MRHFPTVEQPPIDFGDEAMQVWFEALVVDIDERIEVDYLRMIEDLLRLCR